MKKSGECLRNFKIYTIDSSNKRFLDSSAEWDLTERRNAICTGMHVLRKTFVNSIPWKEINILRTSFTRQRDVIAHLILTRFQSSDRLCHRCIQVSSLDLPSCFAHDVSLAMAVANYLEIFNNSTCHCVSLISRAGSSVR